MYYTPLPIVRGHYAPLILHYTPLIFHHDSGPIQSPERAARTQQTVPDRCRPSLSDYMSDLCVCLWSRYTANPQGREVEKVVRSSKVKVKLLARIERHSHNWHMEDHVRMSNVLYVCLDETHRVWARGRLGAAAWNSQFAEVHMFFLFPILF